jgi:hypothetical protein
MGKSDQQLPGSPATIITERVLGSDESAPYMNEAALSDPPPGTPIPHPAHPPLKRFPGVFPAPAKEHPYDIAAELDPQGAAQCKTRRQRLYHLLCMFLWEPARGYLSARLDRWAEFFDLESRVMSYRVDIAFTLAFGTLGVGLFVLSWFLPELNAQFQWLRPSLVGVTRMLLVFAGAYLAFLAWPRYVRKIDSVAENDADLLEMERAHRSFHDRLQR